MGIFARVSDVIASNVNDLIDKTENPEKLLKQVIHEIEDNIDQSKQNMAKIMAEAKGIEKAVDAKSKEVDEWVKRAEMAVSAGNDDLAKKALERKITHEKELDSLQLQADETRSAADQIKENIKLLSEKLTEARSKMTSLAARASAAKTSKAAQKQVRKLTDSGGTLNKLEKIERKVENMEAEAGAMAAANQAHDQVEEEFHNMEKSISIDSELAALKAKLGK